MKKIAIALIILGVAGVKAIAFDFSSPFRSKSPTTGAEIVVLMGNQPYGLIDILYPKDISFPLNIDQGGCTLFNSGAISTFARVPSDTQNFVQLPTERTTYQGCQYLQPGQFIRHSNAQFIYKSPNPDARFDIIEIKIFKEKKLKADACGIVRLTPINSSDSITSFKWRTGGVTAGVQSPQYTIANLPLTNFPPICRRLGGLPYVYVPVNP